MAATPHIPVLIDEVIASLAITPGEHHVDGTFGAGGYSRAMIAAGARVTGFDRDPSAIAAAQSDKSDQLTLVEARFSQMAARLGETVDGLTLDIGVSSMQLDQGERGFSFQYDGPLDMRMEQAGESAADFLNSADEEEIARIIYHYGDEPKSRRIAHAIVAARPITRTGELARIVRRATGWRDGDKKDPATRTFQAIRIHINRELEELEGGLEAAELALKPGGRLAVVTFHSLEDRMVKRFLRERSGSSPAASRHMPIARAAGPAATFDRVAKPVRASAAEIAHNPRSRSATLRVAHRTAAPPWALVTKVQS
ncbi:MAG: 16S rRNA (cytosine(1402)-N(4))-methyltransferase RsmH [Sphingomonadaceae bacterium]